VLQSSLRHLLIRQRAFERRVRRQEVHMVGLRNEVRSAFGADPIDPYEQDPTPATDDAEDRLDAFKYRVQQHTDIQIERDLT